MHLLPTTDFTPSFLSKFLVIVNKKEHPLKLNQKTLN